MRQGNEYYVYQLAYVNELYISWELAAVTRNVWISFLFFYHAYSFFFLSRCLLRRICVLGGVRIFTTLQFPGPLADINHSRYREILSPIGLKVQPYRHSEIFPYSNHIPRE